MAELSEMQKLAAIERRWGALDGHVWALASEGGALIIDAKAPDGSVVTIARLTGHASADEQDCLMHAPDDVRFLLDLVRRAIRAARDAKQKDAATSAPARAVPNHAAQASMLCERPVFQNFLAERHGLEAPLTKERAAQRLRSVLGIDSRSQINTDDGVRERWLALHRDFNAWKGRAIA